MRSLFIDISRFAVRLPAECVVLELDPLSRELVREISDFSWDEVLNPSNMLLVKALLERLAAARPGKIFLPQGKDPRVVKAMTWMKEHPSSGEGVDEVARRVSCSSRTLARLFVQDTGMSLGAWRTQMKLQWALELLAAGQPVTNVAMDLGYDPTSFSTMFKKSLGVSPRNYFG